MIKKIDNSSSIDFDSAAIEKLSNGDIEIFEELFRQYYPSLLYYANRFVNNLAIAQDIVQDIFSKVWTNRAKLKPDHNIKTYLYIAVRNKSFKYLRHAKVEERYALDQMTVEPENGSPEDLVKYKELQMAIEGSIQNLPTKCRTIFCMNRFDHLKYREIAEIEGISIKTVETQMGRALTLLRNQLKPFLLNILQVIP